MTIKQMIAEMTPADVGWRMRDSGCERGENPFTDYDSQLRRSAWFEGWDARDAELNAQSERAA